MRVCKKIDIIDLLTAHNQNLKKVYSRCLFPSYHKPANLPKAKALLLVGIVINAIHSWHITDGTLVDIASDADGIALAGQMGGYKKKVLIFCHFKMDCQHYWLGQFLHPVWEN